MVNNSESTKKVILDILKNSSAPISGSELGKITKISRVAVWKNIQALINSGYQIETSHDGYFLNQDNNSDIFSNLELGKYSNSVNIYPVLDSTMNEARNLFLKGAGDMTVVTAEQQTAGKGTRKRDWDSKSGGIYLTLILKPKIALHYFNLFNLAAAVSIVQLLNKFNIESKCIWPNDIYTSMGKISGILPEVHGTPDNIDFMLLGIGINVNNIPKTGSSIIKHTGTKINRSLFLEELLLLFSKNIKQTDNSIIKSWENLSAYKINPFIKIKKSSSVIEGKIISVLNEGNLLMKTASGEIITVFPGDEIITKKRN